MIRSNERPRARSRGLAAMGFCAIACNTQVEVGSNTGGNGNTGGTEVTGNGGSSTGGGTSAGTGGAPTGTGGAATGSGGTTATGGGTGQGGASPTDATSDVVDACPGATCPGEPVWSASSTQFSLHIFGGMPMPPFGECGSPDDVYTYTMSTRVLTRNACIDTPGQFDAVVLSTASAASLLSRLEMLRTASQQFCGADQVFSRLTIIDGDASSRTYNGDFYSGCQYGDAGVPPYQNASAPPWLSTNALINLWQALASSFAPGSDSTRPEGGAGTEGGTE